MEIGSADGEAGAPAASEAAPGASLERAARRPAGCGRPARASVSPLVQTYGTAPYADIDPAWLAWAGYVLMFGMMFGDAGEGLVLVAAAVALRAGWPGWARRFRRAWPFVGGASPWPTPAPRHWLS
jgi:V/A-type H+/Na+-transporting ATPase subunit I